MYNINIIMMTKKKTIKKEKSVLDMKLEEVFVVKSVKHRAYIEQFSHTSINFTQKHLGTICGFFIIRNKDKYNAHVVNFLTSEIKKEFFAVSKRNISEAFEAALQKVNRALTELAKNNNVAWLGSIDGAICAYDDKNVYFSVTGEGFVLLIRNNNILELSEGLASQEAATTPLKTFVDTSHGALCDSDRLIITSKELVDLISLKELKNNSSRFNDEEFKQLISTILKNESDIASTTIINVKQKIVYEPVHTAKSEQEHEANQKINVFGADAFKNPKPHDSKETKTDKGSEKISKKDYTDKRTGHIYVQGSEMQQDKQSQLNVILDRTKDALNDFSYEAQNHSSKIKNSLVKSGKLAFKNVKTFISSKEIKNTLLPTKRILSKKSKQLSGLIKKTKNSAIKSDINSEKKTSKAVDDSIKIKKEEIKDSTDNIVQKSSIVQKSTEKVAQNTKSKSFSSEKKESNSNISNSLKRIKKVVSPATTKVLHISKKSAKNLAEFAKNTNNNIKVFIKEKNNISKKSKDAVGKKHAKISINSSSVKQMFKKMSKTTKMSVIFILILICIPLIFNYIYNNKTITVVSEGKENTTKNNGEEKKSPDITKKVEDISNNNNNKKVGTSSANTSIANIANTKLITLLNNGETLITTKSSFVKIDKNNKKTTLEIPQEYGNVTYATYMTDLSYVFFITDKNKIYSYSPKVDEFEKQSIKKYQINNKNIKALGSYLTYIYILDDNTITRYARTEGGFDTATKWYKGESFLNTTSMAIDGDIYITKNNTLKIFSHKKLTDKKITKDTKATKVYTSENSKLVWILDIENKTITGHSKKTLAIEKTIKNDALANITKFSVNEKTKTIIASTTSEIYNISFK